MKGYIISNRVAQPCPRSCGSGEMIVFVVEQMRVSVCPKCGVVETERQGEEVKETGGEHEEVSEQSQPGNEPF